MTERSHWLALERFDYSPLAGRWGVARMLSSLTDDLGVPGQAQLVIQRAGSTVTRHGSFVSAVDRRGSELLWVASFAIPLDIVSCEDAAFGLWTPGRAHVALPAPGTVVLPAGARAELRLARRFPRLHLGRRATAMATAVALGVTSLPTTGLALASGDQALVHRTPADQDPTTAAQNSVGPVAHIAVPGKPVVKLNAAPAQPAAPAPAAAAAPVGAAAPVVAGAPGAASPAGPTPRHKRKHKHKLHRPVAPKPHHKPHHKPKTPKPVTPAPPPQKPHKSHKPPKHTHHKPAKPHATAPTGGAPIASTHPAPRPPTDNEERPSTLQSSSPSLAPATPTLGSSSDSAGSSSSVQLSSTPPASIARLYGNLPGPPPFLIAFYKQAQNRYHVPWQVLAAINSVETNFGRDLSVSSAGAEGWMQFMPETWAQWGVDANHDGKKDPYDPRDAIFAAARYLRANGAPRDIRRAIFAYNHANWYVDEVLQRAQWIQDTAGIEVRGTAGARIKKMRAMADSLLGLPYVWGGGHTDFARLSGYDCSGFVSAVLHAAGYLSAPQTTDTMPGQPGIKPGPGRYVTIFDRAGADGHVIIDINGQFYESGGSAFGGGGAGVKKMQPPLSYLATFNTILHPEGL